MRNALASLRQNSLFRFAGVGFLSTAIDFLVFNVALRLMAPLSVAGALGFFAGFSNGYFFNSRYVFKRASKEQYARYLLVSLGGLGITQVILHGLTVGAGFSENAAKLVAVVIVFMWNYALSKYWAFSE